MPLLRIPYDDLFLDSGQSREQVERELRFLLAAKLYEFGRASAGQAAKVAGMPRLRFLSELARREFTVIHLDEDEVLESGLDR